MLKRFILWIFGVAGYELVRSPRVSVEQHSRIIPTASYSPWNLDPEFIQANQLIRPHTLVDVYRCYELWSLVREASKLPTGQFIEVGVWRGGTGALIALQAARHCRGCHVYLCDTFRGIVKTGSQDTTYANGMHADTDEACVLQVLNKIGASNASILKGIFPEETGDKIADQSFRFCHIDVDVYQSAKDTCEWLWPRLVPDALVVFDDYGTRGTEGVAKFVNEWRQRADALMLYNLNGHAILVKR